MVQLTNNEKKALLILLKDFTSYHNANTLSKKIGISRIGCMKMLKKLEKKELILNQKIGKASIYKPNLENDYARDLFSFLLSDEANNFKRWKYEFKELFKEERVVMLYGSAIIDYSKARDIDVMVIRKKGESGKIHKIVAERQRFIPKNIHIIDLTSEEFIRNGKRKQESIVDIIKNAIILFGQNKYVELIKNVTGI